MALTIILMARKVNGSILLGILITTLVGIAVGGRMSLRRRDVMRLYCYVLLALEQLGFPIPTQEAIREAIDPCGQEYESLGACKRDFRRRRCDLLEMFSAELKVRWLQSEPGDQMGDVLHGLA